MGGYQNTNSGLTSAIYVHWPFCKEKCPYCDFNSHVRAQFDYERLLRAYLQELAFFDDVLKNRVVTSIFFGGGTPSLAPTKIIASIINKIILTYKVASDLEITLEANPTSVESSNFQALAAAGVNRVSIGIQSLRPSHLSFLGRTHSTEESLGAIALAHKYFKRFSLDFIYALPNQTASDWLSELEEAHFLSNGHLSLYQLTVEKGTPFYQQHRAQAWHLPKEELAVTLYQETANYLSNKGLHCYEVSNYAIPGQECRHNLNYWRYGDYIGIGAGAHGRYGHKGMKYASQMWSMPEKWLQTVEEKGVALQQHYVLTDAQIHQERLLVGMRLSEGVALDWLDAERVRCLQQQELVRTTNGRVSTTEQGRLVLNSVIQFLLTGVC